MKKIILFFALIIGFGVSSSGQTATTIAFSESYGHEYKKDYTSAIASLTGVYDANSYEINLRLGWLYYLKEDYLQSEHYYKNAMKLKPNSVEAMFGYVYPLAAEEKWDMVIATYEEILKIDPKNYTANIRMANIFYYRKDFTKALTFAETNRTCFPFDYSTNLVVGQINIGLGKINEAKTYLNKALLYYPESEDVKALLKTL